MDCMDKAKHIIWIVVDSMRSYVTGKDDRDKLDVMNELAMETTEFANTICSAPSSLMSIGSTMSSLPSYYIGVNYKDFKYNTQLFPSFPHIWKDAGNRFVSFLNSLETREVFDGLLFPVSKKYYPKGLSPLEKSWPNAKVTEVLQNYLTGNTFETPTCFFVWYNIRMDPTTSQEVANAVNLFKEANLWDDSFCIVTADHGYLDPKRGYTPERLRELGLTHDILVTEDQIKIPLCIKYPGIPVQDIKETVSSLDITPTLLDYFGIEYPSNSLLTMYGESLLSAIEGNHQSRGKMKKRLIRADGRFIFQPGRITAIRGERYKYVYQHDEQKEAFFDISKDFFEDHDLSGSLKEHGIESEFKDFQEFFRKSEADVEDFILMNLFDRFKKQISREAALGDVDSVFILQMCDERGFDSFVKVCSRMFPGSSIHAESSLSPDIPVNNYTIKIAVYDHTFSERKQEFSAYFKKIKASYKFLLNINMDNMEKRQDGIGALAKRVKRELKNVKANPSKIFKYHRRLSAFFRQLVVALKSSFGK